MAHVYKCFYYTGLILVISINDLMLPGNRNFFFFMYVFITLIKVSSHYQLFPTDIANISLWIKDDHFNLSNQCYFFISHLISVFRHFFFRFWRFQTLILKVNDFEVSVCSPRSRSQLSTRTQSSFGIKLNLNPRAGIMFFFRRSQTPDQHTRNELAQEGSRSEFKWLREEEETIRQWWKTWG